MYVPRPKHLSLFAQALLWGVAFSKSNQAGVPVISSMPISFEPISFRHAHKAADVKPRAANEWQNSVSPLHDG